jgi:hypothetical protein
MEMPNETKQQFLDATHKMAMEHIQQYVSGLITFSELANGFESLAENVKLIGSKDGLLCPNTGLRFHKDFR